MRPGSHIDDPMVHEHPVVIMVMSSTELGHVWKGDVYCNECRWTGEVRIELSKDPANDRVVG